MEAFNTRHSLTDTLINLRVNDLTKFDGDSTISNR